MTAPPARLFLQPLLLRLRLLLLELPGACGLPGELSSSLRRRQATCLMAALIACALLLEITTAPVAQAEPQIAGLQCRLGGGPWQPCRMEVQDVGLRWLLLIGDQRIEFRHSGDGAVRMQKGTGPWQPVTATWKPDTSLCWDGVCAKGAIPLD